jgi:transcriptional regulator with XRE-family HTH domain
MLNHEINIQKQNNAKEIASRFRSIRRAACYSQEDIGNLIGVSYQQVQKYEAAMDRIPAVSLYLLAKSLDISVKEFFPESSLNAANDSINNEIWTVARKLMAIKDPVIRKKISSLLSCLEGY